MNIEVFRSVIRAWDGREQPTQLTELLLSLLGYDTVGEMFDDFYDNQRSVPIDAARLLFAAAAGQDAVALEILNRQGVELGKSAAAVIRRLGMENEAFDGGACRQPADSSHGPGGGLTPSGRCRRKGLPPFC
ncbi:hypothetical protein [Paenibacillus sp. AR247]|uniref:hypothetical protein n=1 Tax=Paenibacillus sp. AR247 TaxID=1631599 RepID=UPI00215705AA|nr:hypothetical protein [Paenibacillus sp. AR247]